MFSFALQFSLLLSSLPVLDCSRHLRGNGNRENYDTSYREPKSLLNTFPFNAGRDAHDHDHHGGGGHHGHGAERDVRLSSVGDRAERQGSELDVSFPAVAASAPGPDGKRCIDKVEMVEELEYDDVVQCDHSYDKRCHTTYVTNYDSQQEEECEENFRKTCFIEYEQVSQINVILSIYF